MFYLVDLVKKFVYSCVSPGTSIQRQICGMWNLNSTTTLQVCFWACSTLPHSPSPHHVPLPSIPSNTWKTQKTSNGGQWEPCASSLTIPCCCLPHKMSFFSFFFPSLFLFSNSVAHLSIPAHCSCHLPLPLPNLPLAQPQQLLPQPSVAYWPCAMGAMLMVHTFVCSAPAETHLPLSPQLAGLPS